MVVLNAIKNHAYVKNNETTDYTDFRRFLLKSV